MNIKLKPISEITFIMNCFEEANLWSSIQAQFFSTVYYGSTSGWVVHPSISDEVLYDFMSLLNFVEEEVEVPLTDEQLWQTHSAFEAHVRKYPDCPHTARVWDKLTSAVASLAGPPY